jgi:hypothetical protein
MSNSAKQNHSMPQPVRVPPGPSDLESEITAQPRQLSDEVGLSDGGQGGLSVDPEDLGVRFLSEATEQGEALTHPMMDSELSLIGGPGSDEVLTPPNFERENTLWEQTVDLVTQTENAAAQLRAPGVFDDESEPSDRELEEEDELRTTESSIRELSLFDREGESGDDTIVPDIEPEDGGRHARSAPSRELGAQIEGANEPPAAASGKNLAGLPRRAARAALRGTASALRRFAQMGDKRR